MPDKYLVMISLDAVSSADLKHLEEMPNFKALRREGTLVRDVQSVFISNTYPAHTSIITGTYPFRHGIQNNTYFTPGKYPENWRWDSSKIRVPALWEEVLKQGMRVCSILYPVTGKSKITYNFPEFAGKMNPLKRVWKTIRNGTPSYMLSILFRLPFYLMKIKHIRLDDLTTAIAADTIKKHCPELLLLHLIETDEIKHQKGPDSSTVIKSLEEQDKRIGLLVRTLQDAGIYDETGIIIFSDHGCLPVHTQVDANIFLQEKNLIQYKGKKLLRYDAYFYSAGGTAFLRVFNREKAGEIEKMIMQMKDKPYFSRFLTSDEMKSSGMDSDFQYGIEAAEGYSFSKGDPHGQHGYGLQREDYYPFYFAKGSLIPVNQTDSGGSIIDICPLAAEMLGIPKWPMDGQSRRTNWISS